MSKPKIKWDTKLGLDYSSYFTPHPKNPDRVYYIPHEFKSLFKNTKLIGQSDLEGRGDTFQLVKQGNYAYVCHKFNSGFSVVDVKDRARFNRLTSFMYQALSYQFP